MVEKGCDGVDGQEGSHIACAERKELYIQREGAAEPAAGEETYQRAPQAALGYQAEGAPGFGAVFLIPYAPYRERTAARVDQREIGQILRE